MVSRSAMARFLACCVTHAESGCAVAPTTCTRLVETSMKNKTESVFSRSVSTVKKSQARMPEACERRNSVHVGPDRRGAGSKPWRSRIVRTVVAETRMPSFSSSPRMRW